MEGIAKEFLKAYREGIYENDFGTGDQYEWSLEEKSLQKWGHENGYNLDENQATTIIQLCNEIDNEEELFINNFNTGNLFKSLNQLYL